jgi:hypothetical protein
MKAIKIIRGTAIVFLFVGSILLLSGECDTLKAEIITKTIGIVGLFSFVLLSRKYG